MRATPERWALVPLGLAAALAIVGREAWVWPAVALFVTVAFVIPWLTIRRYRMEADD